MLRRLPLLLRSATTCCAGRRQRSRCARRRPARGPPTLQRLRASRPHGLRPSRASKKTFAERAFVFRVYVTTLREHIPDLLRQAETHEDLRDIDSDKIVMSRIGELPRRNLHHPSRIIFLFLLKKLDFFFNINFFSSSICYS